jgi:translation initiation factor 5B
LSAKQKADKQRAQLSLEIAKKEGRVVVGKLKPLPHHQKDNNQTVHQIESQTSEEQTDSLIKEQDEDEDEDEEELQSSDEDVRENWEELSEDEKKGKQNLIKNLTVSQTNATKESKSTNISISKSNDVKEVESEPPKPKLRSPVVCVLGHVDTGKTKLLDYIRKSHIQDNEAGGITQQIGATFVPPTAIHEQCRGVRQKLELQLPGLLIIDTPGHESFTNLRSRGSSLCDIAILVIDIMHGLEQQTLESINLLKARKTPFIVALNKVDRLYEWRSNPRKDIEDMINSQMQNTKLEFQKRCKEVIVQLAEQSINAALYYENRDQRSFVSLVPTSAATGDGMGNLIALLVTLTQSMMSKKLLFDSENLDATVLEVKAIPGLGTTIDVILVNGKLKEGDKIVLAGHDGPFHTHIRSLLVPQPLKELRVKSPYQELKCVYGSMGVKITGHDLDKAIAGLQLYVANSESEIEEYKNLCWDQFGNAMKAIKCSEKGVYVQASTLGSLEALLEFLKTSKIPYCGVRIGPVVKRDVMKASIMLESSPDYAVILAFDVKIEKDAQELADHLGVKIFSAEIIYHLFDKFTAYKEDLKKQRREQNKNLAIFPCKLKILPNCIFNTRDPIVVGVSVEDGIVVPGTPLAVPSKGNVEIGRVTTIEINHKAIESARKGQEVCLKIEHFGSDAPKLYGRHFDYTDILVSRVTRESIDVVKEYFRDDLQKSDWQLMIELKKMFEII